MQIITIMTFFLNKRSWALPCSLFSLLEGRIQTVATTSKPNLIICLKLIMGIKFDSWSESKWFVDSSFHRATVSLDLFSQKWQQFLCCSYCECLIKATTRLIETVILVMDAFIGFLLISELQVISNLFWTISDCRYRYAHVFYFPGNIKSLLKWKYHVTILSLIKVEDIQWFSIELGKIRKLLSQRFVSCP